MTTMEGGNEGGVSHMSSVDAALLPRASHHVVLDLVWLSMALRASQARTEVGCLLLACVFGMLEKLSFPSICC